MRKLGVFTKEERFNSDEPKTKAIFMAVQLLYTVVALLPVKVLFGNFDLHTGVLMFVFVVCIWNGASYYIDVFSTYYARQFNADADPSKQPPPTPDAGATADGGHSSPAMAELDKQGG